jgi:hypothetical protein
MELLARTYLHLTWQFQTFKRMFVKVPSITSLGIAAQVLSRFAQVLAFFLPLKVVIMLSSHHVSGRLDGIVSESNLHSWLIGFSVATFILYAMSVFLTTVGNRTITKAVNELLGAKVGVEKAVKKKLYRAYTLYCHATSDAAVFLFGALVLAFVNPLVLIGMLLVILTEIIGTGVILNSKVGGFVGWVRDGIDRNVKVYIQYLSAANFFALFLLIIADYFIQGGIDVFIAILTMILGRLTFNSLAKFVKTILSVRADADDEEE